ncbi:hypothetical protein DENSPDRAFT_885049 [Dentipellis sp. KUC8613]|nr:hypothetical protein DENSPDRAFT_885049 [Dentipellis sp. KUC8613]
MPYAPSTRHATCAVFAPFAASAPFAPFATFARHTRPPRAIHTVDALHTPPLRHLRPPAALRRPVRALDMPDMPSSCPPPAVHALNALHAPLSRPLPAVHNLRARPQEAICARKGRGTRSSGQENEMEVHEASRMRSGAWEERQGRDALCCTFFAPCHLWAAPSRAAAHPVPPSCTLARRPAAVVHPSGAMVAPSQPLLPPSRTSTLMLPLCTVMRPVSLAVSSPSPLFRRMRHTPTSPRAAVVPPSSPDMPLLCALVACGHAPCRRPRPSWRSRALAPPPPPALAPPLRRRQAARTAVTPLATAVAPHRAPVTLCPCRPVALHHRRYTPSTPPSRAPSCLSCHPPSPHRVPVVPPAQPSCVARIATPRCAVCMLCCAVSRLLTHTAPSSCPVGPSRTSWGRLAPHIAVLCPAPCAPAAISHTSSASLWCSQRHLGHARHVLAHCQLPGSPSHHRVPRLRAHKQQSGARKLPSRMGAVILLVLPRLTKLSRAEPSCNLALPARFTARFSADWFGLEQFSLAIRLRAGQVETGLSRGWSRKPRLQAVLSYKIWNR